MPNTYKDYNNHSQQDKDSMRTLAADTSNVNEATLISNTDDIESLLTNINTKLGTIITHIDQVEAKIDAVNASVQNADTHIVAAIQGQ